MRIAHRGISRFSDVQLHIVVRANARPGMTTYKDKHYVLPPAAAEATGNTSLAARSGVSSFQRTDPNGRSSMRRTRTGSGPR